VLDLDHGGDDGAVAQGVALGLLYALLGLADQPFGNLRGLAVGLPPELGEDSLDVGRVLAALLEVILDRALRSRSVACSAISCCPSTRRCSAS
jgi:hypothetical protein